jgi:hypothetical protein
MSDFSQNKYAYIGTATTGTQVLSSPGLLKAVVIGETAAGAISIYDCTTTANTPTVAVLKASVVEGTYEFDAPVTAGIRVVAAGNSKFTVIYE